MALYLVGLLALGPGVKVPLRSRKDHKNFKDAET